MTQKDMDQAMLVRFAVLEAGPRASLEQMKAICYCLRNRVRSGWGEWMEVIASAEETRSNEPQEKTQIDLTSRTYQRLVHEIDDIYWGRALDSSEEGRSLEDVLCNDEKYFFYWLFLDRPMTLWFKQTIATDQKNHPSGATMGTMMFFE